MKVKTPLPTTPFLGQQWYNSTSDVWYMWIGRWCHYIPDDPNTGSLMSIQMEEDPIEAYDRVKGIL